jgi:putative acyl-CoA dehydrogenase
MSGYATHEVRNQPPRLEGFNAWAADLPLREAVTAFGADWAETHLAACGARVGSARVQEFARLANRFAAPRASYARPLRTSHRRGRIPPCLARAARDAAR